MRRRFVEILILTAVVMALPFRCPAPLIYTPGEGWYYELFGGNTKWQRPRAKDQLDVAEKALAAKDYDTAMHAASRVLRVFPLSDYAPEAAYVQGRCFEAEGKDEAAFQAYQDIIDHYPKCTQFNEVLNRQYAIANRFLDGEWFRLWNTIPLYPSMDETANLFGKIVADGPFSPVAPKAQMSIGSAHEKAKDYAEAVKAYETAADKYQNDPQIAADAMYRAGVAWQKQADTAEYDQSAASKAISAYMDFISFFPDDPRVATARKAIEKLKALQVQGSFDVAQFYEQYHEWAGAVVYYNDVLQQNANSPLATLARQRIDALKPLLKSSKR